MKKLISALTLSVVMLPLTATAHNLFPTKDAQGYGVNFWADDHWENPKPEQFIGFSAYDLSGKPVKVGYDYQTGQITVPDNAQIGLMTTQYDFGHFTFTKDKHVNQPREQVKGTIYDTRRIYKLGKTIFAWDNRYTKPVGLKMEVTPLQNPLLLKAGDKLKILVTLNGQPFSGAELEDQVGDLDDITTDQNGIATITLRQPENGYEIIGASAKLPYQLHDPKAQTLHLTGTLAFKQNTEK